MGWFKPSTDQEFRDWQKEHPNGFVLNCDAKPSAGYLILHNANCPMLISDKRANYAGGDYLKVCAADRKTLVEWARDTVGGKGRPCGICKP